jgi:hypothetical protein
MAPFHHSTYRSDSASDFIDNLRPKGHTVATDDWLRNWVFRGQGNSDWSLIPSALRNSCTLMSTQNRWRDGLRATNMEQIIDELRTIHHFFDVADRSGHHFPINTYDIRRNLEYWAGNGIGEFERIIGSDSWFWPDKVLIPLMALAQHNGICTRLLDVSRSPYIAAYFSAIQALQTDHAYDSADSSKELAVWAINEQILIREHPSRDTSTALIEIVQSPGYFNSNLVSQNALFILIRQKISDLQSAPAPAPLEDHPFGVMFNYENANVTSLEKHTLPVSEAGILLRLLYQQHGISAERLFSGLYGVVRAIKEREYWK